MGLGPPSRTHLCRLQTISLQIRSQPRVPGVRASTLGADTIHPITAPHTSSPSHMQTLESRVSCSTDVCTRAYTHTRQHTPLSGWLSWLSQQGPNDQEMNKDTHPPGAPGLHTGAGGGVEPFIHPPNVSQILYASPEGVLGKAVGRRESPRWPLGCSGAPA